MEIVTKRITRCITEYIIFVVLFICLAIGLSTLIRYFSNQGKPANKDPSNTEIHKQQTIILDAGHGGEDGGAIGKIDTREIHEKDLNLSITLMLRDLLEAEGFEVILTRETDTLLYDRNTEYKGRKKALDLAARLAIGENTPNAIFVSIHMNSFPQKQYQGLQVYYSPNHPMSQVLAQAMQTKTAETIQPDNNRTIKKADSNIYLLHHMTCPSVLVECGFLSNEQECRMLCEEEYQKKIAQILFSSICQTLAGSNDSNEKNVFSEKNT